MALFKQHKPALDELFHAFAQASDYYGDSATDTEAGGHDAEVRAAFAAYDRNASGGIDAGELQGALGRLGLQTTSQQAQRVLARYDSDGSRELELTEFRQLVDDLKSYQTGNEGGSNAPTGNAGNGGLPDLLAAEELISMVHGFRLVPKPIAHEDVRSAVREMQTSSTADVSLLPFSRERFEEVLLRLAHYAAAASTTLKKAEAATRLDDLFRSMLLYDVPRMRALVHEHRLREACATGDLDVVKDLLAKRVAVDAKDHDGWTAVHRCCVYGHDNCLRELIHAGASLPQRGPNGYSPMHFAAEFGHLHCVHALLSAGASHADLSDGQGWTPLQRAAIDGHTAVVNALLNANTDNKTHRTLYPIMSRDKQGDTALHDAASNGHTHTVKALCDARADLDAPNVAGLTPIDVAKKRNHKETAEFLELRKRQLGHRASKPLPSPEM